MDVSKRNEYKEIFEGKKTNMGNLEEKKNEGNWTRLLYDHLAVKKCIRSK